MNAERGWFSVESWPLRVATSWWPGTEHTLNILARWRFRMRVAQSLTLSNDNTTPMLLQVWTDAGNIDASPDGGKGALKWRCRRCRGGRLNASPLL
ncbi:hypothetical protein KCP71_25940 [Salmonella enterica subsp. enterica]|nr:hypothetical protein KCP71_25940 [Salmonella enterica subsp. enterica]